MACQLFYLTPRSIISTPSALAIQRILLHLTSQYAYYQATAKKKRGRERGLPYQNQPQTARVLPINKLLRVPQQHVHIRVDALELAAVLGLAPF